MQIKVIAATKQIDDLAIEQDYNDEMFILGGRMAGVCYAPENYFDERIQNFTMAIKRADGCCKSGHHSPFDHGNITLQIIGIPKIMAMILNSTQFYTTSEKSARYTVMRSLDEKEQDLYEKWRGIFNKEIKKHVTKLGKEFTDKQIDKLAIENARYMLSVFTPTSMCYTTSYRQFNYLIQWLDRLQKDLDEAANTTEDNYKKDFYKRLSESTNELYNKLRTLIIVKVEDNKDRKFSFFAFEKDESEDCFRDVYSIKYQASFSALAQLQRHRTINYEMFLDSNPSFFVPPLLSPKLKEEWVNDAMSISDHYPQCTLVNVTEEGRLYDFVQKSKERLCARAQLEIFEITKEKMKEFYKNRKTLKKNNRELVERCVKDNKVVPRCMFGDFTCTESCIMGPKYCFKRKI